MSEINRDRDPGAEGEAAARADVRRTRERWSCPDCGTGDPRDHSMACNAPSPPVPSFEGQRDPAEEGILAARADNRRAREIGEARKAADLGLRSRTPGERRKIDIASRSANRLHSALGYLEAALGELEDANQHGRGGGRELTDGREAALHGDLETVLAGSEGLRGRVRHLRDVRAARAGFAFDDEG